MLIENGSQNDAAATKLGKVLTKAGFNVLSVQQADHSYLATQIENFNPKTASTSLVLEQLFGVLATTPGASAPHGVDIIVILGQDSAASVEATA